MDRRTFLTTMLQGSLAATLRPNSISPLLIAQYASLHHLDEASQQNMRIAALGIGRFGVYCSRMLAYSVHNISCHEVPSGQLHNGSVDFSRLPQSILHADLLFLLADTNELSSAYLMTSCMGAVAIGVQTVVIGPSVDAPHFSCSPENSPIFACTITSPATARDLVALVADLVNTDSFVGIDHADVKAILSSGSRGLFACSENTSTERESQACRRAIEQLQQQGLGSARCCGAMACIYGSPGLPFDHYHQAITTLDNFFTHEINFVFGAVADEHLTDSVKVAILAMQ